MPEKVRSMVPMKSAGSMMLIDGFYCSTCQWEDPFDEPTRMAGPGSGSAASLERFNNHKCDDFPSRERQYFQLDAGGRTFHCDFGCDSVAQIVEVDNYGHEYLVCLAHTSSNQRAAALPKRKPDASHAG